jgi:PKD repeat protein
MNTNSFDADTIVANNPSYVFTSEGFHNVSIINTSNNGCINSLTQSIFVLPAKACLDITELPQINTWLRADSGLVLSDSIVDSWSDIIYGKTFSASSSDKRPYKAISSASINNKPFISFDGVNDALISNSNISLNNDSTTLIIVAQIVSSTFYGHVVSYGAGTSGSWDLRLVGNSGRLSLSNAATDQGAGVSGSNPIGNTSVIAGSSFVIISGKIDPVNKTLLLEENFELKHSATEIFNQASSNPLSIGCRLDVPNLVSHLNLAELMLFNGHLSETDIDKVKTYLQYRYSKPVSLGVDINVPYGFCGINVNAENNFIKYKWNNNPNDTLSSLTVNQSGTYFVEATDVFGFKSYDTINVNFPTLNPLSDATICIGNSTAVDLGLSGPYAFNWNNGETSPSISVSNAGSYFCTIADTNGCSVNSDTAVVTVDEFSLTASLGPDTSLCSGNVLYLKNGAEYATNYSWSNGSTDSTLTITQSGTYWLSVSNVNGCSVTDSINLIVNGFAPNTLFTLTDACINDSVAFLDLSTTQQPSDVVSSWLWDFGDGNTSTLQNPKHLFDTAGNYIVSLETTTNSGCSKVKKLNYTVYPLPVPSFSFLNNCQYANTQFTFNGNTYGDFLSGIKWQFGLNPLDTSNSLSPVFVFTQSGPQPVTITIKTEKGCVISENSTVNVKQGPLADFYASEACAGENITLVDISDVNFPHTIINREWNFGDGSWAGNSATPSHFYILPGKYNVFLKVTASSGCSDTVTKTIAIDPKPVANFGYENNCLNSPTLFTNSTGISNIGGILWEIDDLFSTTQDSFNYVFNDTGRYTISFIIKTSGGCADTVIKTLTISSLPIAAFNLINSEEDLPVSIELENKSLNATTFLWNFDDGNISSSPNPVHVYTKEDDYTIKLFAFNAEDCIDSTQKDIRIKSAKYDLALLDLNPVINNKGFLEPEIRIANLGTRIINNFDVYLIINGENSISEDWNGTLLPGQTEVYRLKSGTKINIKENTYMCISVANPNQKTESDSTNNVLCKELLGDNLVLADISPNPAKESILAPIISPEAGKGNIYIYSKSGQLISENAIELMKGIQLVPINIKELNNGLYTLSVSFKDKQVSKRFMKE